MDKGTGGVSKEPPFKIGNPNFFVPVNEVSILSEPQQEQDVIALFNQLIAGGVIRGIRLMATNQHEKYDGVFRYILSEPLKNHIFDKATNPLGIKDLVSKAPFLSKPCILEYKYDLDALIRDFENESKYESDIDLTVVWQVGNEWKKRYSVISLLDLENLHHREFHGLTHIVCDEHSGDRRFDMIVLSELIAFLDDVDQTQSPQRSLYGAEE
jgi:hypothetical protein